jgi:Ankyrin repeat
LGDITTTMVRKSNDDTPQRGQRLMDGGPPLQRYSSAISDLIELNADGTRRNSQHALKISPASAFKKASVTTKEHTSSGHRSQGEHDDELDSSKRGTTGTRRHAGLHAPPLVFVDDEDEQERGGDHPQQHLHDQEVVVRALFKSPHKGQQQQPPQEEEAEVVVPSATTTTTTTTAKEVRVVERSRSAVYSLEDADKRTRLLAYLLQDAEWKQLFPTCAALSLAADDDDDDDDDSRVLADADFDVDTFLNMTTNATTLETPLHTVCWKGPPQLALLMLETIPTPEQRRLALLKRDVHGNTPLHIACAHLDHSVDFTVIKNLLLLAPEALDQVNSTSGGGGGDSPLHLLVGTSPGFARRRSSSATTTTTLQDSSSSSSSSSTNTKKKLDFSVEAAAEEAISSLLQMVGHWATLPNDAGLTLLHCAIAHGAHERVLVKLLSMSMSASVGPTIMGGGGGAAAIPDNRGMLPLHFVRFVVCIV